MRINCRRIADVGNWCFWCTPLTQDLKLHPKIPEKLVGHGIAPGFAEIQFICISGKICKCGRQHFVERDKTPQIQTPPRKSVDASILTGWHFDCESSMHKKLKHFSKRAVVITAITSFWYTLPTCNWHFEPPRPPRYQWQLCSYTNHFSFYPHTLNQQHHAYIPPFHPSIGPSNILLPSQLSNIYSTASTNTSIPGPAFHLAYYTNS